MRSHYGIVLLLVILLSSCATPPPRNTYNICSMFHQYPNWKHTTLVTQKKYGIPIAVQMAIIHQESKFNPHARPPRTKLLWIIPWKRPSTAYGYTQALHSTWTQYKHNNGWILSSRNDFADGVDFIGWYANSAYRKAGISRADAYSLYLAYHEGVGGYARRSYASKPWLLKVANHVAINAANYHSQLVRCQGRLPRRPAWWHFW